MSQKQAAKRVYTVEHIELLDGTEIEVKPLPIKRLRRAQDAINAAMLGTVKTDDEGKEIVGTDGEPEREQSEDDIWDAFVSVVELVMQGQESCEKFLEPEQGRDLLEDTLDQDTLYEIVRISTGYDFLAMQKQIEEMMRTGATL